MAKLSDTTKNTLRRRSKLVYAGRRPDEQFGFINTPVYRGSTVLAPSVAALTAYDARFTYGTKGTPTTQALEEAWSELCGATGTVLAPSGLAAISLALMAVAKAGDHILVTDSVYRPARHFFETVLKRLGVETQYYDPAIGAGIAALLQIGRAHV